MHGYDHTGAVGDGGLDFGLVDVHGVWTYVHEDELCAHKHKGRCRGREGVAGKDDLVPRLKVAQEGSHFQGGGAAGGQKGFLRSKALLYPLVAALCEGAVAGNLAVGLYCFMHICEFRTNVWGLIEVDHSYPLH